jgi:hypothetical protein
MDSMDGYLSFDEKVKLMKEINVPPSVIRKYGHVWSIHQADAQQTAYLTIMQTLQDGKTYPEKIVDKIIKKVTEEAAKQATFTRLTIKLPDYL